MNHSFWLNDWIRNLNFEFKIWISNLKLEFKFQTWISILNFKLISKFNFKLILKFNLKFEFRIQISYTSVNKYPGLVAPSLNILGLDKNQWSPKQQHMLPRKHKPIEYPEFYHKLRVVENFKAQKWKCLVSVISFLL